MVYKELNTKIFNFTNVSEKRRMLMSRIKSFDTNPEVKLRKALWAIGIRYKKNYKKLPGRPDILISKNKIVVFIDGEFWHGHNWIEKKERIKNNKEYWISKIENNMKRDLQNNNSLQKLGYTVLRFWSNEVNQNFGSVIKSILDIIEIKENQGFEE